MRIMTGLSDNVGETNQNLLAIVAISSRVAILRNDRVIAYLTKEDARYFAKELLAAANRIKPTETQNGSTSEAK